MLCSAVRIWNLVSTTKKQACQKEKKITALMHMNFKKGWYGANRSYVAT